MAIETQPESAQAPGGGEPGATPKERAWWMRPNIFTALVGAVIGYYFGHWLGNFMTPSFVATGGGAPDDNDLAIVIGYGFLILGWLIGLGVFNDLVRMMLGKPLNGNGRNGNGLGVSKYFRFTLDHKVVGLQYLIGMLVYFFTGGLLAIGIRTELLSPSYHVLSPTMYLQVVGEHGTMMMMMMTSVIVGPFGNYLIPLMIGSKRVAFPRIEALSFWLTPCAYVILLSSFLDGGFPTGWTGYAPLSIQAGEGMDGYAVAFGLMGLSIILAGFNMVVTIICYRAPGMRWSRLPMFVWAMLTTGFLFILAAPVLVGGMYMIITDRTAQTAFFVDQLGGSNYLYQDLFWFFGHPEVYILALPGFGIVQEIIPVFTRKPLFGYKIGAAGMFGVAILSFFVWQHHLFDSGMDPDMRPLFMLTTELISIPTGFTFLCGMMTIWRGRIRFAVPMLFCLAWFFNFLIGGLSGIFLSDTPSDVTTHGSFFSMAHFHYTIMGGLIFTFFAAIYYWVPKMTGWELNERLGKIHFWTMFIFFNSTFAPLFAAGFLGQPRRTPVYSGSLKFLNDWVSISAFLLGISMLIFLFNLVWSLAFVKKQAEANPWGSRSIEFQLPSPVPVHDFDRIPVFSSDPYGYGEGPMPSLVPAGAPAGRE